MAAGSPCHKKEIVVCFTFYVDKLGKIFVSYLLLSFHNYMVEQLVRKILFRVVCVNRKTI